MSGAAGVQEPKAKRGKRPVTRRRNVMGFGPWTVHGKDPSAHYTFVNKASKDMGIAYYESLGYTLVRSQGEDEQGRPRGVFIGGGKQIPAAGTVLEFMDYVLMALSKEEYDEIVEYGELGSTGQSHSDEMERRIRSKRGVERDPLKDLNLGGPDGPIAYLSRRTDEPDDQE